MTTLLSVLYYVVYIVYIIAAITDVALLGATKQPSTRIARHAVTFALVLHTVFLLDWLIVFGSGSIVAPAGALTAGTWAVVLLMLITRLRYGIVLHEPVILMIVVVLLTLEHAVLSHPASLDPAYTKGVLAVLFPLHTIASYLGLAAFLNAAAVAANYLMLDHALKTRKMSLLSEGTVSLELLDRAHCALVAAGLIALLAGIVFGVVWMVAAQASGHGRGKLILTAATVVLYLCMYTARRGMVLIGKRMAWTSLALLLVVVVSFMVVH